MSEKVFSHECKDLKGDPVVGTRDQNGTRSAGSRVEGYTYIESKRECLEIRLGSIIDAAAVILTE